MDATKIRAQLWDLLGDIPDTFTPKVAIDYTKQIEGISLEHFTFANGVGDTVYGYLLIPNDIEQPAPAILYNHLHGGRYKLGKEIILQTWSHGHIEGIELAKAGFIVIVIDCYAFGERYVEGHTTEENLFKHFLWQGRTLWGMMLHDDLLALAYLRSRDEVDSKRIGTTGMSLGGSRATWLSALDDDIKVTIPIAQMTRYADFAATENYDLHSIYYYVPNMFPSGIDMEHIVSLSAPRYQHILIGEDDPLSPIKGVEKIADFAKNVYAEHKMTANFNITYYPNTGHVYTPQMFEAMLAAFKQNL
jgi:dienelactone hydrolase